MMITWENLKKNAYSRYSGLNKMCVTQSSSGKLYPGVRIENASFPLSITEYQSAVFGCLSEGDTPQVLYLPPDADALDIPSHLVKALGLDVVRIDILPEAPNGTVLAQTPSDFRSTLSNLQANCRIEQSNFPVSCLLETESGAWISGVNIEFTDWQLGLCAERTAMAKAVSNGFKSFKSIHIHAPKGQFISPCGACRQVLVEHMPYQKIVLYHPDGTLSEHTPAELLPAFFSGESIK
jgi:homotetrameric cytidine deaminase